MKIDFNTEDALIVVAADKRKGVWSNNSLVRNQRNVKTAGSLPTMASAHTLLTVALVAALKSITRRNISKLIEGTTRIKPTVVVASQDRSFLAAINSIVQNEGKETANPLHAGKNFLSILKDQLWRFHLVTRSPEDGDFTILALADWANKQLAAPKLIAGIPPSLAPTIVSVPF